VNMRLLAVKAQISKSYTGIRFSCFLCMGGKRVNIDS